MAYFHASVVADLDVGDRIVPARQAQQHANPRIHAADLVDDYDDGARRHDYDVVWLCTDADDALDWGSRWTSKATGYDMWLLEQERGRPVALVVYEVEPGGPVYRRLEPHSPTEHGCDSAVVTAKKVVEVYDWRDFFYERNEDGTFTDLESGETFTADQAPPPPQP